MIQDSLQGSTVGVRVGGSLTSEGYKPGIGSGHIYYKVPRQVVNGYIEFEMKGFSPSLIQDAEKDADNGFFGMYDGRGISEPIKYFDDFKYNYFRWNFHYRQNRSAFKAVITCAAPTSSRLNSKYAVDSKRDWFTEPTGINYSMSSSSWYKVKCEWNNKTFKVTINGTTVWSASGPYDYAPIDFRIWLGSAPGYDDKYVQLVKDIVFRNFKLVAYGSSSSGTAPVITSSPGTSGTVGQAYSYDVNASGSPTPSYSLTTAPSGMTISSSTGLIQWTPSASGSYNVSVRAANGVSPNATQSWTINVGTGTTTSAPRITSSPGTSATVGQAYSYDVNASGSPTPTYSLTTAPSGMTISSSTGLIQWTPSATGSYNVGVRAANGVSPDATQSWTINVGNDIISPPDPAGCHPALVSYWKLDETSGSRYADSAGGNSGTSSTPPTPVSGRVNGAQQFNGTSHGIMVPRIAAYDFGAGTSFTLEAWIKRPTGSYSGEEVILERRDTSGGLSMKLGFNSTSVGFTARSDNYQLYEARGTTSLFDGRWHHVVGVRDAARNQLRLYVDGVLQRTVSAPYSAGFTSSQAGFTIGYRNVSKPDKFFPGAIDEVAVYKEGLDAATIALHYNNGLANKDYCGSGSGGSGGVIGGCDPTVVSYWKLDETSGSRYVDSAGSNNGTSSTPPTPVSGRVNGAQQFNGTSHGIMVPRIAAYDFGPGKSFSLEAWIKRPTGSYSGEEVILERRDTSGGLSMKLGFNSTSVGFTARNDSYQLYEARGTTSLFDGRWHHVVGVRDAARNQLRIYVDGALQRTVSAAYSTGFTSPTAGFTIGYRNVSKPDKFFPGAIDEVAIHNVALDATTIAAHYSNGLANKGYCDTSSGQVSPSSFVEEGEGSIEVSLAAATSLTTDAPAEASLLVIEKTSGEPQLVIYGSVGKTYLVEESAEVGARSAMEPSWSTIGIFTLNESPQIVPETLALGGEGPVFFRATEVAPIETGAVENQ